MSKIKEFIKENKIDFSVGQRNSSCVVLVGYAQHLGLTESQLQEELKNESIKDSFIAEEVTRLFDYCKARNYKYFWDTPKAKELYKF